MYSEYPLLKRARSWNLFEVWYAISSSWLATCGRPKCIQVEKTVNGQTEFGRFSLWGVASSSSLRERVRALVSLRDASDLRAEFTDAWGRRKGFAIKQILSEVQDCLGAPTSSRGRPAHEMVSGPNPAGPRGRGDGDGDLKCAQEGPAPSDSSPNRGNSARWRRRPPRRRWSTGTCRACWRAMDRLTERVK